MIAAAEMVVQKQILVLVVPMNGLRLLVDLLLGEVGTMALIR